MSSPIDDYFSSQCALSEIPARGRCTFNTRNPHLPCAVHPCKIVDAQCPDFELDTSLSAQEWWEPEGASYYAGELMIEPIQRWTREQKIALLDWHPMFTGRCPDCERTLRGAELPLVQTHPARVCWDCQECGWRDDSV